jgi:cytochrome c oxidase assembly protein subunit 15
MANNRYPYSPWLHRVAIVTAVATFILICIGGLVTSTDSGLAVPDWPTTFGTNMFLYPLSKTVSGFLFSIDPILQADLENAVSSEKLRKALDRDKNLVSENITISTLEPGQKWRIVDADNQRTYTAIRTGGRLDIYVHGILYEHSHRLIGSAVGILTVALTLLIFIRDPRKWLKWVGAIALVAVIVQGVMGGLRVEQLSRTLAIVHACLAQAFFALTGCLVLFTSRGWLETTTVPARQTSDEAKLRRLTLLTTGFIYIQLIFGAILRHTGSRLDAHLLFAALVTIHIFLLTRRILTAHFYNKRDNKRDNKRLVSSALILSGLLILQLILGLGAYLAIFGEAMDAIAVVAVATSHVSVGALMLATSVVLTLRIWQQQPVLS